jgi:predicted nucleotidyltransferase
LDNRFPLTSATPQARYGSEGQVGPTQTGATPPKWGQIRPSFSVVGRNKVLAVVDGHLALSALRTLVDLTIGPLVDLEHLYDVDGVERVLVFGSWARRHLGEPGPTPRDVDVLVVGTPDDYAVTSVCLDLSGQYGVEVSPMIVSSDEFATRGRNPILDQIASGPLVEVRQ